MRECWLVGALVVVIYGSLLETKGYPIEDLVVKLPGQSKVEFSQYSGYVDIDVKHGRSLFYYFVEAEHEPNKKPLTLWLNGGNNNNRFFLMFLLSFCEKHMWLSFLCPCVVLCCPYQFRFCLFS